jgi:hypothetical protein
MRLRTELGDTKIRDQEQRISRNIVATDRAIDEEVVRLYSLTEADWALIRSGRQLQAWISAAARQRLDDHSGLLAAPERPTDVVFAEWGRAVDEAARARRSGRPRRSRLRSQV